MRAVDHLPDPSVVPASDEASASDPFDDPADASPVRRERGGGGGGGGGGGVRGRPPAKRVRIGLSAAVVLVLLLLGLAAAIAATRSATSSSGSTIPLAVSTTGEPEVDGAPTDEPSDAAETVLYVHVLGAVSEPGLYTLDTEARVVDAIAAAGGFSAEADPGSVNLARTLTDGEQILVLRTGESPPATGGTGGGSAAGDGGSAGTPVNLNTASAEQLDTLPRIGPALAERIISWRTENGPFRLVDELLAVPGIGDATLAGLEGLVTV